MTTERTDTKRASSAPASTGSAFNALHRVLVIALVVAVSLLISRPAAASCLSAESVAASVANAEVVFVGTVLSTANRDRVAQVRVEEVWKGRILSDQVEVHGTPFAPQDNAATSVDRTFRPGVRYLFVPRGESASPAASGVPVFEDGLCTATQEYHPNLDGLRPASDHPAAPGRVHGEGSASGRGARVPVLPVAVAMAAVAVAMGLGVVGLIRPPWVLRRG